MGLSLCLVKMHSTSTQGSQPLVKKCGKCGCVRDLVDFHKNSKSADGRGHWCRACVSCYMKQRNQKDPERNRKAALTYYHEVAKTDKTRLRTRARDSYRKHRESRLVGAARYRKSPAGKASKAKHHNKRRLQIEIAGVLDLKQVAQLFASSVTCCFCNVGLVDLPNHPQQRTLEHLTPLSREGTNHISNLAISCRRCNARKHTLTAEEFRERRRTEP